MISHDRPLAENEAEALFVKDGPGSGTTVTCSKCLEECIVDSRYTKDSNCPNQKCRCNLVYRPWWEW